MRKKIIAKGFEPKQLSEEEHFEGEFNGTDVNLYIATNNNKVYRIMLCDKNTQGEADIIKRFNRLVQQFEKNKRYISADNNYTIPEDEDISYEKSVKNIIYQATFYQKPNLEKAKATHERAKIVQKG